MATLKGGDKAAVAISELGRKLSSPATVRVGFLEKAKYPQGINVAAVATFQEFGTRTIPPRPFFRNMIAAKQGEWPSAIAQLLKDTNYDVDRTLALVGEAISGQLRESIIATNAPPLSPVTLMLRKMFGNHPELIRGRDVAEARRRVAAGESYAGVSTKPLVWTGFMLGSVDYEVKKT